jgi:hypothetical protein
MTDGQCANLSWCQATIWDPQAIFLSLPWKLSSYSCVSYIMECPWIVWFIYMLHDTYLYLCMWNIYTGLLAVQDQYSLSCPIKSNFSYNGSLVTWDIVQLTAAKFKPLMFCLPAASESYHMTNGLVSGHHLGPMTSFSFFSMEIICRHLHSLVWGTLSDERTSL